MTYNNKVELHKIVQHTKKKFLTNKTVFFKKPNENRHIVKKLSLNTAGRLSSL